MTGTNNFFSAMSFITFVLVCIPFPWHLEAWNTGTCLYMGWTAITCLCLFINSVIWNDNAINWAPVWCDITSKLIVGISVAIPAASLCINRRLYYISTVRSVMRTRSEKYRAIMIDLAIGVGLPVLVMILHYIVQGHRFNIFEEVGCYPFTYNVWPAYILVHAPPLIIALISGTYGVMSIISFRKRQSEFREILSSNSNLSSSRYFRLMALAGIEVLSGVPLSITVIVLNATEGAVQPWISWEDTHWGFSRVDQIPSALWKADPATNSAMELNRWLIVVCGLVFFGFFGFADEAQKHYKMAFSSVAKRVGVSTSTGTSSTKIGSMSASTTGYGKSGGKGSTFEKSQGPIYVSQEITEKRDSLDTLSDLTSVRDFSDMGSDLGGSPTSSPYNTLTKQANSDSLMPPALVYTAPPTDTTASDTPRPLSFPVSVTPSASFLDLSSHEQSKAHDMKAGNDNRV